MMWDIYVCAILLLLVLLGLWLEASAHERRLQKLPLRILVNGTRGKSSVTRLIAAGLRHSGRQVIAKTTGTEPKIILPDGTEQQLRRRGPANIRELIHVVRQAEAAGADTLVTECMAVRPELQWFAEHRLVKSHIGVITNIRADHEDVLGKGLHNVAAALANTLPAAGILVTTPAAARLLAAVPGAGACRVVVAVDEAALSPEALSGFPYEVVPENLALALKVCELAGVPSSAALAGMRLAAPDAGNVWLREVRLGRQPVLLLNALAANDPESTLWLWQTYAVPRGGADMVLINCRPDRRLRTSQLCQALSAVHQGPYLLCGDTGFAARQLARQGIAAGQIRVLPDQPVTHAGAAALAAPAMQPVQTGEAACLDPEDAEEERRTPPLPLLFAAGNARGMENLLNGENEKP